VSFDALSWAAKQKPGNLAAKMVLLALANYANDAGEAYPSTAAIAEFGDMNHKTATVALDRLEVLGLISDTGRKSGRSGQIKVYRLNMDPIKRGYREAVPGQYYYTYMLTNPETGEYYIGQRSCGCLPENDRYMGSGLWPKRMAAEGAYLTKTILETYPNPDACSAAERAFIEEAADDNLCRNVGLKTPKNTPPNLDGLIKTPKFSSKATQKRVVEATQKRVTDTVREPVKEPVNDDANASEAPRAEFDEGSAQKLKPEHVVEAWNDLAIRIGRPKIRALTPERRQAVKARINGYSVDDFQEVLTNIERSPFLSGEKGRFCTFDWITKKANFQKILEGNYNS